MRIFRNLTQCLFQCCEWRFSENVYSLPILNQLSHHPCVTMDQGLLILKRTENMCLLLNILWCACTHFPENQTGHRKAKPYLLHLFWSSIQWFVCLALNSHSLRRNEWYECFRSKCRQVDNLNGIDSFSSLWMRRNIWLISRKEFLDDPALLKYVHIFIFMNTNVNCIML